MLVHFSASFKSKVLLLLLCCLLVASRAAASDSAPSCTTLNSLGNGLSLTANLDAHQLNVLQPVLGLSELATTGFIDLVLTDTTITFYWQSSKPVSGATVVIQKGAIGVTAAPTDPSITLTATGAVCGSIVIDPTKSPLASIVSNPSGWYVLVKSGRNSVIRGQLQGRKVLYAYQESNVNSVHVNDFLTTPNTNNGDGFSELLFIGDPVSGKYKVCWRLVTDPLETPGISTPVLDLHVHNGYPIRNMDNLPSGAPAFNVVKLIPLFLAGAGVASPMGDPAKALQGCVTADQVVLTGLNINSVRAKPFAFYNNLHTKLLPTGEQRGQLEGRVAVQTTLTAATAFPANKAGGAVQTVNIPITLVVGDGGIAWTITGKFPNNIIGVPTVVHLHVFNPATVAGIGMPGPVVVTLASASGGIGVSGVIPVGDVDLIRSINFFPGFYYVNVHTSLFPAGAIGGALDYVHHTIHAPADGTFNIQTAIGT